MINLLPPEFKSGYIYARRNVILRKWLAIFLVALVGLGALGTYGLLTLRQSEMHFQSQVSAAESGLKADKFTETQKRVQDITSSFKLAVQVLGQEVLFSQLLQQIGTTIPAKSSLTGLAISQVEGGIDISAQAVDYNTATQMQVNLADPKNRIFERADIVSITCTPNATGDGTGKTAQKYPCAVQIRALFAEQNPFLLINNSKAAKP